MPDTYWDRAAQAYLDFWVPRLIPYYDDLVQRSAPKPGERVLVTCAGPGGELLAVARAMQGQGTLVATDNSGEMLAQARKCLADADLQMEVTLTQAEAADTLGTRWDLILSAFSLWQLQDRRDTLRAWRSALSDEGRVGLLVWGPPDPAGPFEMVAQTLLEMEPALADASKTRELAAREAIGQILHEAGLLMVRHAILRHPMEFASAQGFFSALSSGWNFLNVVERLGIERTNALAEAFYNKLDPPSAFTPLMFSPTASVAIAQAE